MQACLLCILIVTGLSIQVELRGILCELATLKAEVASVAVHRVGTPVALMLRAGEISGVSFKEHLRQSLR